MNDEQIKGALRQAFITVEKGFFQSLDDALAEKTELQLQMPEVHLVIHVFTILIISHGSMSVADVYFFVH